MDFLLATESNLLGFFAKRLGLPPKSRTLGGSALLFPLRGYLNLPEPVRLALNWNEIGFCCYSLGETAGSYFTTSFACCYEGLGDIEDLLIYFLLLLFY